MMNDRGRTELKQVLMSNTRSTLVNVSHNLTSKSGH